MADAEIKALIETMHIEQFAAMTSKDETQIDKYFDKFYSVDMVFIRPSGNPMDVRSAKGMWLGDDVKTEAQTLKSTVVSSACQLLDLWSLEGFIITKHHVNQHT